MGLFKSIRSWRISRLRKEDAWLRLLSCFDVWFALVVVFTCYWCAQSMKPTHMAHVDLVLDVLCVLSVIGIVPAFVNTLLGADDYYKIVTREHGREIFSSTVYLYRRKHNTYKMTVINHECKNCYFGTSKMKYSVKSYDVLKYADRRFFLFTLPNDESCWYSLGCVINGEQKLGVRIEKTAFWLESTSMLSVLNNVDFVSYHADKCFFNNINIVDKTHSEESLADTYVILQKDEMYQVFALYFKDTRFYPQCVEEKKLNFSFSCEAQPIYLSPHNGVYGVIS